MPTDVPIITAIVETDVLGVKAYHCRCLTCGWQSRRYDRRKQADRQSERHVCGAAPAPGVRQS